MNGRRKRNPSQIYVQSIKMRGYIKEEEEGGKKKKKETDSAKKQKQKQHASINMRMKCGFFFLPPS